MFKDIRLSLISTSPRRKAILEEVGIIPEIFKIDVEENIPEGIALIDAPSYLAKKKAIAYLNTLPVIEQDRWYLGADTMVIQNNRVLEKPVDKTDAQVILKQLSNTSHQVVTGYYLQYNQEVFEENIITEVHFKDLSDEVIDYYIDTYQPYDKAGGYGIQEWIGQVGIERINGDFYAVMGLPIAAIMEKIISQS